MANETVMGPFYWHDLTLILAWMNNYILYNMWNDITYPLTNFNGATIEVWEWICNFIPYFTGHVITYHTSMLGLKLIHVSKMDPMWGNMFNFTVSLMSGITRSLGICKCNGYYQVLFGVVLDYHGDWLVLKCTISLIVQLNQRIYRYKHFLNLPCVCEMSNVSFMALLYIENTINWASVPSVTKAIQNTKAWYHTVVGGSILVVGTDHQGQTAV